MLPCCGIFAERFLYLVIIAFTIFYTCYFLHLLFIVTYNKLPDVFMNTTIVPVIKV